MLVVAERDRGTGPVGRRLGELHGEAEMAQPAGRCVAADRPAVDIGFRDLFLRFLDRGLGSGKKKIAAGGNTPRGGDAPGWQIFAR